MKMFEIKKKIEDCLEGRVEKGSDVRETVELAMVAFLMDYIDAVSEEMRAAIGEERERLAKSLDGKKSDEVLTEEEKISCACSAISMRVMAEAYSMLRNVISFKKG